MLYKGKFMSKKSFNKNNSDDFVNIFKDKVKNQGQSNESILNIDIEKIITNEDNPRKNFREIDDLANSIKENGLIQPIIVTKKNNKFVIIAGERRFRAYKLLAQQNKKFGTIPAIIRSSMDNSKIMSLIENLQREDLSDIEESSFINTIRAELNVSQEELGTKIGKSRDYISGMEQYYKGYNRIKELIGDVWPEIEKISKSNIIYLSSKTDDEIKEAWNYLKRFNFQVNQKEFRKHIREFSESADLKNRIFQQQLREYGDEEEEPAQLLSDKKTGTDIADKLPNDKETPAQTSTKKPSDSNAKQIGKNNKKKNQEKNPSTKPVIIKLDDVNITISFNKGISPTRKSAIIQKIKDILGDIDTNNL